MHRRLLQCIGRVIAMHFKTFKVPNAGHDWAASGTSHYIGMLYDIFTFLLMLTSILFSRFMFDLQAANKAAMCTPASGGALSTQVESVVFQRVVGSFGASVGPDVDDSSSEILPGSGGDVESDSSASVLGDSATPRGEHVVWVGKVAGSVPGELPLSEVSSGIEMNSAWDASQDTGRQLATLPD